MAEPVKGITRGPGIKAPFFNEAAPTPALDALLQHRPHLAEPRTRLGYRRQRLLERMLRNARLRRLRALRARLQTSRAAARHFAAVDGVRRLS